MNKANQQINSRATSSAQKPGKKYITLGKFLGFLALITIPAMPLYTPLYTVDNPAGRDTVIIGIPIAIAAFFTLSSLVFFVIGLNSESTN